MGEGWSAPRCLGSGSPFFQGHVPLPRGVQLALQTPTPQFQMCPFLHRPLRGRPLGMRLGRGRGGGGADSPEPRLLQPRARARPPRCRLAPPCPCRSSSAPPHAAPPLPANPKAKIAMPAVCTSLDSGCTVPPSSRPPEGPRRLGLPSPRPQILRPLKSRASGFAAKQARMKSWPQEVSGLK